MTEYEELTWDELKALCAKCKIGMSCWRCFTAKGWWLQVKREKNAREDRQWQQ